MRVAVLSDLHIGALPRTDAFLHDTGRFTRFLDRLEATHDRVVLLGDVYQCDHGLRADPASMRRQLDAARARSGWLTERLARPAYRLVHGNHDAITADALGAPTELRFEGAAGSALLTHGDRYDPVIGAAPGLSAAATWFCGRARWLGLRPLAGWLEERDIAIKADRYQTPDGPYAQGARALMRERGVRFVVFGHTHAPWRLELPEGVLLNTGSCSRGRLMYASLDLDRGIGGLEIEA